MEDRDWTIEKISQEPPTEWANPKGGTIYYRKVMLQGHDAAVSVGKKSPDALQVGAVVYGHIEGDKFKAGQKPNFGGGGYNKPSGTGYGASKPSYQPRDDDAIRAQWAIGQAVHYCTSLMALPDGGKHPVSPDNFIESEAKKFFAMVDRVKGSTEEANADTLKPAVSPQTSKPWVLKQGDPVWPSDKVTALQDGDPEFASLVAAGLMADGVPKDELPPGGF